MYEVIEKYVEPKPFIDLNHLDEHTLSGKIIVAEKGEVQDILVSEERSQPVYDGLVPVLSNFYKKYYLYNWTSLYVRDVPRTKYLSKVEAIKSRLEKGMKVYIMQNRGELREFLKWNGKRIGEK